jgi:hypothetical protein
MREEVRQRALDALNRMMRDGLGIMEAARVSRSSRRSIRNMMRESGIRAVMRGGRLKVIPSMEQRINAFIMHMNQGYSATASAKAVSTTVRTMRGKTKGGSPIIVKNTSTGKWELNVLPMYHHSIVVYGRITGLGDNVQGSGNLPVERLSGDQQNRQPEEPDDIKSPEADSAIWFQVDFNDFISTLSRGEVGSFYAPKIMEALKEQLETPNIVDVDMVERFLNNDDVRTHSSANGRLGSDEITRLEQIMSRYDVSMKTPANYGVDDNLIAEEVEFVEKSALGPEVSIGDFQIFMLRDDETSTYPSDSPEEIRFDYDLSDE